jgi:hypothetical protein
MFGYMNYKIENAHLARLLKIERTNTNRDFRFSQDLGEHAKVSWSQWQCVIAKYRLHFLRIKNVQYGCILIEQPHITMPVSESLYIL